MTMVIRHFPYFLVVAEEEHFQRAAMRLNSAQSALSRRMRDLEAELGGVQLFERLPRGVRLTAGGRVFLEDVRRILAESERAGQRAARVMRGQVGSLRVTFNEVVVRQRFLADVFQSFRHTHPDVEFELVPMISDLQHEELGDEKIDAGFMFNAPPEAHAERLPILTDRLELAMLKSHPMANKPDLRLEDIKHDDFIWASRKLSRPMSYQMIAACQAQGISPHIVMEVYSSEITFNMVAMGVGVGWVPSCQRGREPENVVVRRVEDFEVPLNLELVWPASNKSPVLAAFVAAVAAATEQHRSKGSTAI